MGRISKEQRERYSKEKRFYTYILLDPRRPGKYKYGKYKFDYEPFYVGKGTGCRYRSSITAAKKQNSKLVNLFLARKIKKIIRETNKEPIIIKIIEKTTEYNAFRNEIKFIDIIGRRDLKKGPLCNLTDGGDGSANISEKERKRKSLASMGKNNIFYGKHHSQETKELIRKSRIGKKTSQKIRRKLSKSGKQFWGQKEIREKCSKMFSGSGNPMFGRTGEKSPLFGRKYSKTHKKKMSIAKTGKLNPNTKKYEIKAPDKKKYIVNYGIENFIKKHPEYNITRGILFGIAKGKIKNSRSGWKIREIPRKANKIYTGRTSKNEKMVNG